MYFPQYIPSKWSKLWGNYSRLQVLSFFPKLSIHTCDDRPLRWTLARILDFQDLVSASMLPDHNVKEGNVTCASRIINRNAIMAQTKFVYAEIWQCYFCMMITKCKILQAVDRFPARFLRRRFPELQLFQ